MKNLSGPLVRILLLFVAAAAGWGLLSAFGVFRPDAAEQVQIAQQALAAGDSALAESMALAVIEEDPKQYDAWVVAAVAAIAREDFEAAEKRFDEVPDDESAAAVQARLRSGDMQLNKVHRLSAAEDQFRRAYRQQKPPRIGVEQLALLLGIGGRYREQGPFLLELIRDEKFNNLHLYLLQEGRKKSVNPDSIPMYIKTDPDDPAPQIARAGQQISQENFGEAILILRRITKSHPKIAEAHAKLGQALLADGRRDELADWDRQLPKAAEDHPDVWVVRAQFAQILDQSPVAIRCLWEAVRRDPNNYKSCLLLGRLLSEEEGEAEPAAQFQRRAVALQEFSTLVEATMANREIGNSRRISELAESLGLIWEAFGWSHLALRLDAASPWASDQVSRLRKVTKDLPLVRSAPGKNPAEEFDLSRFPLPDWKSAN
jgi:thioredoxin-like negative regulator of GroEL